ncbi:MAG: hypothetical protein M3128_12800, partial [Verrucomicrobiota bacterium]|nr:hypothetical protein [Verrucomicrobiota bacterium]
MPACAYNLVINYVEIIPVSSRSVFLLCLIVCDLHATPSGLNNIPTADTAPQGTLVLQVFSTVGGDAEDDFNVGFKTGLVFKPFRFEFGASPLLNRAAQAGADGLYPQTAPPPEGFDFTKSSGALQPDTIVDSACQFCNSNCRLKVHLKDGRIIDVLGETADPVQDGGLCVKGPMMTQLYYNQLRLTSPLKRVGGEKGSQDSKFEPCSWDDALGLIATKFLALRDAGEAHAIANKTSGRLQRGTGSIIGRFFTLLGSP